MRGVTKAAKEHNGRNQMCKRCAMKKPCPPYIWRICYDAFIEGFRKGTKWAENEMKCITNQDNSNEGNR